MLWDELLRAVSEAYGGDLQVIDAISVRVHPHAGCAEKDDPSHGMNRSHGGLISKIHALVNADGRPIALKISGGQAPNGWAADDLLGICDRGTSSWKIANAGPRALCEKLAARL